MLQTFFMIFIYLNMSNNNGPWHDHLKCLEFLCSVHLYKFKSNLSEDEIVAVYSRDKVRTAPKCADIVLNLGKVAYKRDSNHFENLGKLVELLTRSSKNTVQSAEMFYLTESLNFLDMSMSNGYIMRGIGTSPARSW